MNLGEKKKWIKDNWNSLASRGKLPEALKRYFRSVAEEKKNQREEVVNRAREIFAIGDKP